MTSPILTEQDFPAPGSTSEREDLDFKKTTSPQDTIEMAKDVAALANTAGGTVLVGAESSGNVLVGYPGIPESLAKQLAEAYEQAASQRCTPAPQVATKIIRRSQGDAVLAVNVVMSPFAPVGVNLNQQIPLARLLAHGWALPHRVGSHTAFLRPDQFGSLENMSTRRVAALLMGIPLAERPAVHIRFLIRNDVRGKSSQDDARWPGELTDVSLDRNVATFLAGPVTGNQPLPLVVPLDWVRTVWRDTRQGSWEVVLHATLKNEGSQWLAHPWD
jgi:hypothetical protein